MTMWTDNRNHLLDDVLRDIILVCSPVHWSRSDPVHRHCGYHPIE